MSEMFYQTGYKSSNFDIDTSSFDTSNVYLAELTIADCTSLSNLILGPNFRLGDVHWNQYNGHDCEHLFPCLIQRLNDA